MKLWRNRTDFEPFVIISDGFLPKPDPKVLTCPTQKVLRALIDKIPTQMRKTK